MSKKTADLIHSETLKGKALHDKLQDAALILEVHGLISPAQGDGILKAISDRKKAGAFHG
jgi:hypothetical protein